MTKGPGVGNQSAIALSEQTHLGMQLMGLDYPGVEVFIEFCSFGTAAGRSDVQSRDMKTSLQSLFHVEANVRVTIFLGFKGHPERGNPDPSPLGVDFLSGLDEITAGSLELDGDDDAIRIVLIQQEVVLRKASYRIGRPKGIPVSIACSLHGFNFQRMKVREGKQ